MSHKAWVLSNTTDDLNIIFNGSPHMMSRMPATSWHCLWGQ